MRHRDLYPYENVLPIKCLIGARFLIKMVFTDTKKAHDIVGTDTLFVDWITYFRISKENITTDVTSYVLCANVCAWKCIAIP